MTDKQNRIVTCDNCGFVFPESDQNKRYPCPECGCKIRNIKLEINEELKLYDSLGLKVKDPKKTGKAKTRVESFCGFEKFHKLNKMVKKERRIDRENDEYSEKIVDPDSGDVIHECNEKISKHRGHGSAKFKRRDK